MFCRLLVLSAVGHVVALSTNDDYSTGEWRQTLDSCWTEGPACNRVMTVSHGGDWNAQYPYDSMPAFQNAYDHGADAVKGDFRVAKDNIGVVMHSSPVEWYESFNCRGEKVEEMTSDECTKCEMIYTNYTFITVPEMLAWADGKINVMYCVKESSDIARAITTLIENGAQHRAFLEIGVDDMLNIATLSPQWSEVYFVIEIHNKAELTRMLSSNSEVLSRTFLFEFNDWEEWDGELIDDVNLVKSYGIRTFAPTNDSQFTATVDNHLDIFAQGFDVVYTYNLANAVTARMQVNTENEISPP